MPKAFEVTIEGQYQNELVVNRLGFYSASDNPQVSSAYTLVQALGFNILDATEPAADTVLALMLLAQTSYYRINKVFARNLFSVTDFYLLPVGGVGWQGAIVASNAGSAMSFQAQKLVTNRVRTDVRAGTLALTAPNEGDFTADGSLTQAKLDLLQDICDYLNAPPSYSSGQETAQFVPAVWKKIKYTPDPAKPHKTAYKYPDDLQTLLDTSAIGVAWSPVTRVTSQVSRRIGKGR